MIYNNGYPALRLYSRVLEFKLDEPAHTVKGFTSFNIPGVIFTDHIGSVQKQGDNYFIWAMSLISWKWITRQVKRRPG